MPPQDLSTIVSRGPAENIKMVVGFVTPAITSDSSSNIAPAWLPGFCDRILYSSIIQPASVTPVHPTYPGLVELLE